MIPRPPRYAAVLTRRMTGPRSSKGVIYAN